MNSVHRYHRRDAFADHRHFILSFHDSTFECIAKSYAHEVSVGPLNALIAREAIQTD
jgi:hypothetical protein